MKGYSRLKNKKGVALESAIVFMVSIFTFCFLLSSLSLLGHSQAKINAVRIENDLELDQIGERYLEYVNKVNIVHVSTEESGSGSTEETADGDTGSNPPQTQAALPSGGMMLLSGEEDTQLKEEDAADLFCLYINFYYNSEYSAQLLESDVENEYKILLTVKDTSRNYNLIETRVRTDNTITFKLIVKNGETDVMYIEYQKALIENNGEFTHVIVPIAWRKY